MVKRKKRLEKHKLKAETEKGRKDTTPAYWEEEKERFRKQKKEEEEKLKE